MHILALYATNIVLILSSIARIILLKNRKSLQTSVASKLSYTVTGMILIAASIQWFARGYNFAIFAVTIIVAAIIDRLRKASIANKIIDHFIAIKSVMIAKHAANIDLSDLLYHFEIAQHKANQLQNYYIEDDIQRTCAKIHEKVTDGGKLTSQEQATLIKEIHTFLDTLRQY